VSLYKDKAKVSPGSHAPARESIAYSTDILPYALPRKSVATRKRTYLRVMSCKKKWLFPFWKTPLNMALLQEKLNIEGLDYE